MAFAAISGGALGGVIGAIASAKAASKQMAFQKEMYRNRYQYTMDDMEAAGLNPMLAANLGGGSVPPGASHAVGDVGGGLLGAVKSYREERMQKITRETAATNAKVAAETLRMAKSNADIRGYEADISRRNRNIGMSPHGVSAYKASLIPKTFFGTGHYLGDRVAEALKGPLPSKRSPKAYPKYRKGYGKTQDIFGRY